MLPYTEAFFTKKEVARILKKIAKEKKAYQELEAERKARSKRERQLYRMRQAKKKAQKKEESKMDKVEAG